LEKNKKQKNETDKNDYQSQKQKIKSFSIGVHNPMENNKS